MPSLVEIGPVVLEKKFFQITSIYFCYLCYYLPLEKGRALHLNKLESPLTKDAFLPSLVEIGPVVLEKIFKFRQCIFTIS